MTFFGGIIATVLGIAGLIFLARPRWSAAPSAVVGIIGCAFLTIGGIVVSIFSFHATPAAPAKKDVPASFFSGTPPPASAGRQVHSNHAAVAKWREIAWQPANMRLEVPADWQERQNDANRLDVRSPDSEDRFVDIRLLHVKDIKPDDFNQVALLQSASRLAESRIEGYTQKKLGQSLAVISIERRANGSKYQLTCNALAPNGQLLNIFVGAPAAEFDQLEPMLGAIVDSIRIGS